MDEGEKRGYGAVLFDLDGTLVDTYRLILGSMRHATRACLGREIPEGELMSLVGTPLDDQMVFFAGGDAELGAELARVYREHNERTHDREIRRFPGVEDMLAQLRRAGLPVAVVTSKKHALAMRGIRRCGLEGLVDFVIGPDDFPAHKPDPGPVLEGCRRAGVEPSACLFVGDSPFDIQAGNAAGCATVAVSWGVFTAERLAEDGPTYTVGSPAEICSIAIGC